ncbi:MAG: topoisomerase 1, partial [Candidatus Parcubacteria bacterium]
MSKALIIVESPTKAKTIARFLGKDYVVKSSMGHIRDLPKSKIGVDPSKDFQITYEIPAKAKKTVTELKKLAKSSEEVILATDEDREGEAISWHLAHILKLKPSSAKRMVFHEITESAIKEALASPRYIDLNLVDAQQARRALDRLVGYKLSPFLWQKVQRGLSAGRVQSVALRLIVDREREIEAFQSQEYWTISGIFRSNKDTILDISSTLTHIDNKRLDKFAFKSDSESQNLV